MRIPEDVENNLRQLLSQMTSWAYRGIAVFTSKLHPDHRLAIAEDIVQESFMEILKKPEPSEPIANWPAYLRTVVMHKCFEAGRQEGYWRRVAGEPAPEDLTRDAESHQPSPEKILVAHEESKQAEDLTRNLMECARKYILNTLGRKEEEAQCFLKIVRMHLQCPELSFDGARQVIARSYPQTPSKATASRWWLQIRHIAAADSKK